MKQYMILKPTNFDPNHYFSHYINCAPEGPLLESLDKSTMALVTYMDSLAENRGAYAYEEGKWTIKQVLQHINDTERVLAYRAFRISRQDKTNLVSFDHDLYAENDFSDALTISEIKEECIAIRQSTRLLYVKIAENVLDFKGMASHFEISPRALGFVISGHSMHHLNVLTERYEI